VELKKIIEECKAKEETLSEELARLEYGYNKRLVNPISIMAIGITGPP